MPRQKFKNSFTGGLDTDSAVNKYRPDRYYGAKNIRINTNDGLSDGLVENVKGNKQVLQTTNDRKIIGIGEIEDSLILVTTSTVEITDPDTHVTVDYIYKVKISDIKSAVSPIILSDTYYFDSPDGHLVYKGALFLSQANPVDIVTRYESEDVQKIYFIDDYNPLRHLNTVNSDSNPLRTLDPSRLSILPSIGDIPDITARVSTGGNLRTSAVQYYIQFYELNGVETSILGPSNMIYISKNSDRGSDIDDVSGKSVNVSFNYTEDVFNRVRILASDFTTLEDVPSLRIVAEQELVTGINSFIDTGKSLGSVLAEELNIVKSNLISNTISIKDDVLFVGNITEDFFDITDEEFDARAYRFDSSGFARIYDYDANSGSYNAYTITYSSPNWDGVAYDHDAINFFNFNKYDHGSGVGTSFTGGNQYPYKYQIDRTTLGGTGKYISYRFTSENGLSLDNTTSNEIVSPSISFKVDKSYHRGEVYRFAIVFFDKNGRQSFAKWIADIRMPFMSELPFSELSGSNHPIAKNLFVEFKVDIPQSVKNKISGYKIVRAERSDNNRSIIASGILSATAEKAGGDYCMGTYSHDPSFSGREYFTIADIKSYYKSTYDNVVNGGNNNVRSDVLDFVSPEINFNKNITISDGDKIAVEAIFSSSSQYKNYPTGSGFVYTKFKGMSPLSSLSDRTAQKIVDGRIVSPVKWDESPVSVGPYLYKGHSFNMSDEDEGAKSGTRFVCYITNSKLYGLDKSPYTDNYLNYMIANYTVDNSNQYGGGFYSSRVGQDYIDASQFFIVNDSYNPSTYRQSRIGDVFITMFEYLRGIWDVTHDDGNHYQEVIYFPIESTINTQLKSNKFSSILTGPSEHQIDTYFYKLQETVSDGVLYWPRGTDVKYSYPEDATDLYIYNSVYSRDGDLKKYVSKPFDFKSISDLRYTVAYSEKKFNGEYTDSWTNFKPNNRSSVDSDYGPLTKLLTHNDRLYFFQPKAFGVASVNERSVIQDNNTTQLVLGTGGVLDRFDYISTDSGSSLKDSIVGIQSGVYFIDDLRFKIARFANGLEYLSDKHNISSLIRSGDSIVSGLTGYDYANRDILFTFKVNSTDYTVAFNEFLGAFSSSYAFHPSRYKYGHNHLISTDDDLNLYLHNEGNRGVFYGNTYDSSIELIINPNQDMVNIFDIVEWLSTVTNSSGVEQQSKTLSNIRLLDSYQDSGLIDLSINQPKRRFRTWRFNKLRADDSKRFRDSYLEVNLTFDNSSNEKLILNDIITTFYPMRI